MIRAARMARIVVERLGERRLFGQLNISCIVAKFEICRALSVRN